MKNNNRTRGEADPTNDPLGLIFVAVGLAVLAVSVALVIGTWLGAR